MFSKTHLQLNLVFTKPTFVASVQRGLPTTLGLVFHQLLLLAITQCPRRRNKDKHDCLYLVKTGLIAFLKLF